MPGLFVLLSGVVVTLVIGVVTDVGWAGYVIGAVLAVVLWISLCAGSVTGGRIVTPSPTTYAVAAVAALVLGGALFHLVGDRDNGAWWAVGFVLAGSVVPVAVRARGTSATADD